MKKTQKRVSEPRRWRTYAMMFMCGGVLVSGFFFAARQHFASMDYGMRNSRLRKQIDDLEAEKRRLILARETSLAPAEIKKVAKKAGLISDGQTTLAQVASTTKDKAVPPTAATTLAKPMILKTASVAAISPTMNADYARPDRIVKQVKKALGTN